MQQRAAAAYVAFFVVLAAGSYGVIATAEAPGISLADSEVDVAAQSGTTFGVGGTQYTLSNVEASPGEEGETTYEGTVTWNETVEKSMELENGSQISRDGTEWVVVVPNTTDPGFVRLRENASQDPQIQQFREGTAWNDTATVSNVTAERALVTWMGPEQQEASFAEGENVTLGDQTFTAHFPSGQEVQFTSDFEAYAREVGNIEYHHERITGFWAVSIIASLVAVLLLAMAYLPTKQS